MAHKLFLDMYMFQIKKRFSNKQEPVNNNDYLSDAYPDKDKKFEDGFVKDIVEIIENKVYKNKANTHGATLRQFNIINDKRYFDIMLDGGLTGIKQFIIDSESREKTNIKENDVTGMMFFARVWFPAGSNTGYVFIQRCGTLTIKSIFPSILSEILDSHGYSLMGRNIHKLTTIKRQEDFLNKSSLKYVYVIGKRGSEHDTSGLKAVPAKLRLKGTLVLKPKLTEEAIREEARLSGFPLEDNVSYDIRATYEHNDTKEEKTGPIGVADDSINIVPNILIPLDCVDADNYPIYEKMRKFVDSEMNEIIRESKN